MQLKVVALICLLVCFSVSGSEYLSHKFESDTLTIQTTESIIEVSALSKDSIEVVHKIVNEHNLKSYAVTDKLPKTEVVFDDKNGVLNYSAGELTAKIPVDTLQISFYRNAQLLVKEESGAFQYPGLRGFRFKLQPDEKLMGGGQRVLGMNRRGHRMPLYNRAHYGYTTESSQMYFSLPAVLSSHKYALLFDNTAKGNLDIGHTETDILQFEAVAGRLAYIVVGANDYPDLVEHITRVTGRQPLPPRWALGNFASRFGYHSEKQTRDTVNAMLAADFPLDAVVLDLFWFGKDVKGLMGNLDWDRDSFPEPEKMIADFKRNGIETILITEPFVLTTSDKWQDANQANALAKGLNSQTKKFNFFFGNSGLIDVFSEAGQDWFNSVYKRLGKQGVSGWWGDLGEPEVHPYDMVHEVDGVTVRSDAIHNAYGHQWADMLYNALRENFEQTRPMILMRAGFLGSQRFGMIPWTGDVSRSWGGLKPQVELALQMSMFGLAYTHSDLGGFAGGESFDQQLYIRWMQYGVFQPVYRPHGQENIAPEPVFHDQQTQRIVRDFIKLRYALLPYNYSLVYQNSLRGLPLMRPMAFEDSNQAEYFDMADQYLWGNAFLVKPVTEPNQTSSQVVLPKGVWFNFWNEQRFSGGQSVNITHNLEQIPVLVRGGSFIPMSQPIQHTKAYNPANLIMHYYLDQSIKQSDYILYEDDGQQPDSIENNQYQRLRFNYQSIEDKRQFSINISGDYSGAPVERKITMYLHGWTENVKKINVSTDGVEHSSADKVTAELLSKYYDAAKNILVIEFLVKKSAFLEIIHLND